jgi:beta-glucosidase
MIVLDNLLGCDFLDRQAPAIALPAKLGYQQLQIIDRHTPDVQVELENWQPTLLQLFIRGNPFRGSAGLNQKAKDWFHFLATRQQLQALVIYGSPYILEQFLPQLPPGVPYAFTYGQMPMAQAIALAALFDS